MKITFEFDTMSEDYDATELKCVQNAVKLASIVNDIQSKVRGWIKYDERESIPKDEIADTIYECIDINMEDLGY